MSNELNIHRIFHLSAIVLLKAFISKGCSWFTDDGFGDVCLIITPVIFKMCGKVLIRDVCKREEA